MQYGDGGQVCAFTMGTIDAEEIGASVGLSVGAAVTGASVGLFVSAAVTGASVATLGAADGGMWTLGGALST
jgi:hypothetical protein